MPQEILSTNNRRIAKNTLFLYIRTLVTLCITLYTSRVVLRALGVDDYGIYTAVGGFVSMFSLLSGALSNAISRFITFELGRNSITRLKEVFSTAITIQFLLALGVVIIAELFGVWFLNVKMTVPVGRMTAANWVFQCSVLTFAIRLISVPYNACIIAHERMTAFAYISILEAVLKLLSVMVLFIIGFDRLIVYAILLVSLAFLIRFIYAHYCSRHFEECHFHFSFNKSLIVEMASLAGWNMLGTSGNVLNNHGVNLLMNIFAGVRVNAARGLANQVNSAVTQFVNSFTTAVNPQITKSYARGEHDYMFKLVMLSCKYSYFLMLILAMPIIIQAPFILKVWLKTVPDFTVLFVRLTLITSLITTLSTPLYTLAIATGDIKKYQIVVGSLSLSCFVFTYLCYRLGMPVESAYYVSIIIQIVILIARLIILSDLTGLDKSSFFNNVILRVLIVSTLVVVIALFGHHLFTSDSIIQNCIAIIFYVLITISNVLLFGLNSRERKQLLLLIRRH